MKIIKAKASTPEAQRAYLLKMLSAINVKTLIFTENIYIQLKYDIKQLLKEL